MLKLSLVNLMDSFIETVILNVVSISFLKLSCLTAIQQLFYDYVTD